MKLPKVYPITNIGLSRRSHAQQVELLTGAGARLVQLREKNLSPREFESDAREAVSTAHSRGAVLIINDRVDIALAIGADGVHLGQDDLPPEAARRILGPKAIIGYSTHSVEQAIEAARLPIDYIAIGPAFRTSTKEDPDPVVGLEGIARVRKAVGDLPLVAIGGIDRETIASVLASGADSAAVIGSVLIPSETIASNFTELANAVDHR